VTEDCRLATASATARGATAAATLALAGALLALYVPVLRDLVVVWLHGTYYGYGFTVPVFSAYLAWDTLKQAADRGPAMLPAARDPRALALTAVGLALLGIGIGAGSLTLRALSLPVVLMGLAVGTLGGALARRLAFPIGFLVFMAPLPDAALDALSLPLQRLAAVVAEHVLRALGAAVERDGLWVVLPSVTLHISDACNGLRFLFAMLVLGTAFAGTTERRPLRGAVIVLATAALAVLANLARVTGTGVMAELWGADAAMGLPHHVWGKSVYAATLVPLAALVMWVRRR
jgi:exosortase